jgi:hypothetical protein
MEPEHSIVTMEMEPEHELWWPRAFVDTLSNSAEMQTESSGDQFVFFESRKLKNKNHSHIMPNYSSPIYPKQFVPNWHSFQIQFFFWLVNTKKGSDQGSSRYLKKELHRKGKDQIKGVVST